MYWEHDVDVEWLLAKRKVLSATDIRDLVAAYKKHAKAGTSEISPAFAALWAEKTSTSIPDTRSPRSEAARGHKYEPYAIQAFNEQHEQGPKFYHWDDSVIYNQGTGLGLGYNYPLGFSPDGLSVPQVIQEPEVEYLGYRMVGAAQQNYEVPTALCEVKSYNEGKHMRYFLMTKEENPDKMQLAGAFRTIEQLMEAVIIYYCPTAAKGFQMFVRYYDRNDLALEIELVNNIHELFNEVDVQLRDLAPQLDALFTEEQIFQETMMVNDLFKI